MAQIGKYNRLKTVRETDNGLYLDGENLGEILMPKKFVTQNIYETGKAEVFVYSDSEDRLIATTETPLVEAGGFEFLSVVATNRFGAFLDWGLPKDLLVPFSEQKNKMKVGNAYLVHVYVDKITNRVVASAKLEKFLNNTPPPFKNGDKVEILVAEETDLGFKVIVENEYWGIIYRNQLFNDVKPGQRKKAFVSKVRDDEKIDILLEKPGYQKIDSISERVLIVLKENNGFLAVNDKSPPAMIQALFGISKKNFKMAVGNLYKKKIIIFKSDGIAII